MANYVQFMRGTTNAYKKLKDLGKTNADTLYFLSDNDGVEGSLYLGTKLIAGPDVQGATSLGELTDLLITPGIDYDAILMYDSVEMKWRDYSFNALTFRAATDAIDGAAGFVPAPPKNANDKFLRGDGVWASVGDDKQIFDEIKTSVNQSHKNALEQNTTGFILHKGDIAIVKDYIADGKYQYTSYIYNGTDWSAMDGNYNAENVYFSEDFIITEGKNLNRQGYAEIAAAGKNISEVLELLFVNEKNPKVEQPSLILENSNFTAYEVGSEVIPEYEYKFNEGSYEFDASTGVNITELNIIDSLGSVSNTLTGEFPKLIVSDDLTYDIRAEVTFSDGDIPHTNTRKEYEAGQIKLFSDTIASETKLTGYRKIFWDITTNKRSEITSETIRSFKNSDNSKILKNFNVELTPHIYRVVIATPEDIVIKGIYDTNDGNTNILNSFKTITIPVEGVNGYSAINYKIYILDFANEYDVYNTFKVKL